MTSHGQCARGGGACECPRVGVVFNRQASLSKDMGRVDSKYVGLYMYSKP